MTCRYCSARVRPCRRFMIAPDRARDICPPCWRKIERAARNFVAALCGKAVSV